MEAAVWRGDAEEEYKELKELKLLLRTFGLGMPANIFSVLSSLSDLDIGNVLRKISGPVTGPGNVALRHKAEHSRTVAQKKK